MNNKEKRLKKNTNPYGTKKRNAQTGYSLQTERFSYTGKQGMRSFKIPLKNKNAEVYDEFVEKIKGDYKSQVGLLNLSDWYEHNLEKKLYSLADFWLDSLRAGVIFAPSINEMRTAIKSSGHGRVSELDEFKVSFGNINTDSRFFDLDKLFKDILKKTGVRKHTSEELFISNFTKNFLKTSEYSPEILTPIAQKVSSGIFNKTKEDQSKFWLKYTGFSVSFTKEEKGTGGGYPHRFFISPDITFVPSQDADKQEYLSPKKVLSRYKEVFKDKGTVHASLGLDQNYNAFDQYFHPTHIDIFRNEPTFYLADITKTGLWIGRESELENRLIFLQSCAKKISTNGTLDDWSNYRSSIGGKLASWVSNTLRQEEEIKKQVFGYEETDKKGKIKSVDGVSQELQRISTKSDTYEKKAISDSSAQLAGECLELTEQLATNINDAQLGLLRQLIGELRRNLNVDFQHAYPELVGKNEKEREKDAKYKRADRRYPSIFRDIRLIPNFIGDTKWVIYEKFIRSAHILQQGIALIESIDKQIPSVVSPKFQDDKLVEFATKQFETLRRKYYELNGPRFEGVIKGIISEREKKIDAGEKTDFIDDNFLLNDLFLKRDGKFVNEDNYAFYTNPHARDQKRTIVELDIDASNVTAVLQKMLSSLKPKWNDILLQNDAGALIDAIEMEKVRLGILLALYHDTEFKIHKQILSADLFESAFKYLELRNNPDDTMRGESLGYFLQAMILSEMKGAVNKISRTEYLERYVVQPMNTETGFPILRGTDPKVTWHIADKAHLLGENAPSDSIAVLKKKTKDFTKDFTDDQNVKRIYADRNHLFDLITSKYQLQFLSKSLDTGRGSWWKGKNINLEMSSYSFIYEQKVRLKWDVMNRTVQIDRGMDAEDRRLFVSIPFKIKPKPDNKRINLKSGRTRYMGIDVGEYGLAWTIIEVDAKKESVSRILKQGFIYEPLTHKVREYVATLKNNQVKGTFGMPNTKLARLRENAITSLRNQVHHIAMRYDAKPIYEHEISNFETGSNRVKVIYDSIKRADTGRGNKKNGAENAEVDLIWGTKSANFGADVSAYATSYICSHCGHSPYLDFENSATDNKQAREELNQKKKLSRPSIEDFLKSNPAFKSDNRLLKMGEKDGVWKTHRGNSAIYVCGECEHISDADIQASYWIALKQAIPNNDKVEKQEKMRIFIDGHMRAKESDGNLGTRLDLGMM